MLATDGAERDQARRASVAHLAWEAPDSLQMDPGSLDLIVGSDLIYGGPKHTS